MSDDRLKLGGASVPAGDVRLFRERQLGDLRVQRIGLGWRLKNFFEHRHRSARQNVGIAVAGRVLGVVAPTSMLALRKFTIDPSRLDWPTWQRLQDLLAAGIPVHELAAAFGGQVLDFGCVSTRVVTTAGVNFLAGCFPNTNEPEVFKFHAFGTGTNAEANGDTALQTELTTQYNPDNTRPTGSQSASTNVYTTVGTLSPDSGGTIAVTEHGILSQAATGGGTLLDRSVFSAVNLVAGSDSLQATYALTLPAGG